MEDSNLYPRQIPSPPRDRTPRGSSRSGRAHSTSNPDEETDQRGPITGSETGKAYTYKPLRDGDFRLILLLPQVNSSSRDIVRCEIRRYPLRRPPQYVALSYAWGDVSDRAQILVAQEGANITINVSASLEAALRTLRGTKKPRLVWADALSIDQQNASEKGDQVGLMTQIYQKADSVAIWLGPRSHDSDLAMGLIQQVSMAENPQQISKVSLEPFSERSFASVVALFERQYWVRLWVVQEVFSAQDIDVHCGPMKLPWEAFQAASRVFKVHRDMLERRFRPGYSNNFYQPRSGSYPQLLVHAGPGSLAGVGTPAKFRDLDKLPDRAAFQDLLAVLRTCRSKLTSDPRDKVFGMLGVLSERVRREIKVDYGLSVKDVYIGIFRTVVDKTKSLDILCDSIHFPTYTNNNNLPSWVPDWSHVTPIAPSALGYEFRASGKLQAVVDFTERNKLRISAIPLGMIKACGTAVGTLCTVHDYLMAFLHWRACFLDAIDGETGEKLRWYKETFCLTLSLWHVPRAIEKPKVSVELCHHIFASMIRDRLPKLAMDRELESYIDMDFGMDYNERRQILQNHFGSKMMGRCFCMTHERLIGMGTGFMTCGDIIVVPLGCNTPVVLRPDGDGFRFVGDVYISGYMHGRAVSESEAGDRDRDIRSYVLH